MRLRWGTHYDGDGNAFGYSVHNRETRHALERAGVVLDDDAETVFHVASPLVFRPVANALNILYTAWESDELPERTARRMAGADVLLVTAEFLVPAYEAAFPGTPVRAVPLGVDAEAFPFRKRRRDRRRPFRFLWVGAPNARKGYDLLLSAWRWFAERTDVELYLKTTVTDRLERRGNMVFDSRRLSRDDLARVYAEADCFVFPSRGEGFGLTLAEAMASGLPCIHTGWSAMAEICPPACGYRLRHSFEPSPNGRVAVADVASLATRMETALRDPRGARRKGVRAAKHIRRLYTWSRTAERIISILESLSRP